MSILQSLYNSHRSLLVNQAALNIVNNNITNMNTEGYSKQRVDLAPYATMPDNMNNKVAVAASGLGAIIDDVSRNRDFFLDSYYRDENSEFNYYKELKSSAQLLEDITNEMDGTGLSSAMDSFYEAAQKLSLNPTDMVTRTDYVERAIGVANMLNDTVGQLNDYRSSLVGDVTDPSSLQTSKIALYCDDLNNKLQELASINQTIAVNSSGNSAPNSLLDERDRILDQISEYLPIEVAQSGNNMVNVSVGGVELVQGGDVKNSFDVQQNTVSDPAVLKIVDSTGADRVPDAKSLINSGKMAAILEMGGSETNKLTINNIISNLDDFAREFANEVNTLQLYSDPGAAGPPLVPPTASACLDTTTSPVTLKRATENIFLDDSGTTAAITASNIQINQNIIDNPAEIAVALVEMDDTPNPADPSLWVPVDVNQVGNNNIALQTAQLRDKSIGGLNNNTTDEFVTSMMGDLGVKAEGINSSLESQSAVVDQIVLRRESTNGVNLDEELVDLTKYQRAYEASARLFSVANEIMQKIINLGR